MARDHAPARGRGRGRLGRAAVGIAVPVALVGLWATLSATGVLSTRLLPAPSTVLRSGVEFVVGDKRPAVPGVVPFAGAAAEHLQASLTRWVVAFAVAVAVGLPLGLGLGLSRWIGAALDPTVQALRSVPITAWLPIALVWFGLGEGAARFLVFVGGLWPIVVATAGAPAPG